MVDSLHLAYRRTDRLAAALDAWDRGIAAEGPATLHRWTNLAIWPAARSATVAGSTGIEGNPLTADEVQEILGGGTVDARAADIRDVRNYNAALDVANRAALRPDFEWTQELLRRLNAQVTEGLEADERGEYRTGPVTVGGIYHPPDHLALPALMADLVTWLRSATDQHALIRAGLAHLNVVSIHPWRDGNGRTSRVVGSLMLMRHGVSAPELVNVESTIRSDPTAYVAALQAAHGPSYQPDRHAATPWLEYFAELSVDRLDLRTRLEAAIEGDIGLISMELDRAGEPASWIAVTFAATGGPVRTSRVAETLGLSAPRARALLAEAAAAGWLVPEGERRGRRHRAGPRLEALRLRTPDLLDRLRHGRPVEG